MLFLNVFSIKKKTKGVYWIRTFNDFHGITKSIKIMVYWIMTFKDKVMVYLI